MKGEGQVGREYEMTGGGRSVWLGREAATEKGIQRDDWMIAWGRRGEGRVGGGQGNDRAGAHLRGEGVRPPSGNVKQSAVEYLHDYSHRNLHGLLARCRFAVLAGHCGGL